MSNTPMETAHEAGEAVKHSMEQAAATAQDMSKAMMEKGMAGMAEFSKLFQNMKFPGMTGMDTFVAAQRRNMEVLSAANRVALEGAQAVARRHMEIMQQSMTEMTESLRDMANPSESPQARAARQADMLKVTYERAVSHIREIADLIQRSNTEAMDLLNKRFAEALTEVKTMADQTTHHG